MMVFVDGPVVLEAEAEAGADKERERSRLREAVAWAVAARVLEERESSDGESREVTAADGGATVVDCCDISEVVLWLDRPG